MKKLWLLAPALLLTAGAVILIAPGLVPDDVYKAKISEQVSKSLGRDVTIAGDVKVSAFPRISASVSDVTLNNPDGFDGAPLARMDALSAKVKLLPLFSKRVEIDSFELVSPQITLIKDAAGRTNWSFSDPKPAQKETEGFARNRDAGSISASLGVLKITNGTVLYQDLSKGESQKAEAVNVSLSVPAMNKPAAINGDLIFEGLPISLSGEINTPDAFLSGRAAPFTLDFESDAGNVKASGQFEASQDLALTAAIDADVPDIDKLAALAGRDTPYSDLADSAQVKGDIRYAPQGFSLSNADVDLKGALINANYTGNFSTLSGAKIDGNIDADIRDLPALLQAIEQDIPQAALFKTADVKAKIGGSPDALRISAIDLTATGDAVSAGYKGGLTLGETPVLSGSFTGDIRDTAAVTQVLGLDIAALKAAQTVTASGQISGPVSALSVKDLAAKARGDNLSLDFNGAFKGGEAPSLAGTFDAGITSVEDMANTAQIELPYANVIGGLKATGTLSGPISGLTASDLNAALSGGLMTADFTGGSVTLGEDIAVSGAARIAAPSVRALAKATGTSLPDGDIFGPFNLSGTVSGTAKDMRFDKAALEFDAVRGSGNFALDMRGTKPNLTGALNVTSGLDLSPYMAKSTKQNKTGGLKPWSEQPLDVSPLRAVNANLRLSTPFVKTDRLELGQSEIRAIVKDGTMTANVPGAQLYSGTGDITMVLDASGPVAAASLDVALTKLDAPSFLGAAAGFDKVTGLTSTGFSVSGQGATQSQLMQSLNGTGNFALTDGSLKGIDLGAFLGGLESAFSNGRLPAGVGPGQITDFEDLLSGFDIQNGKVTVKDFTLSGPGILAEGGGMLDIGNQKIDFSLRPRLTDKAGNPRGSDLAGFGIPVRLSGGFNNVRAGLDTKLLKDIVEARAKAKAADAVRDKVGGPLGDILGGVLGGSEPATEPAQEQTPTPGTSETDIPQTPETDAPADTAPKPEKSDEEKALELLGGIFGK